MIGMIKRCNINIVKPINPDDYFDPSTHTATEANFIAFLEAGGKYDDKSLVGYMVQLGNSVDYNNGLWVIADVNHDSANTGQTGCYDLISQDCISPGVAYGSSNNLKNRLMNPKYNSDNTWYTDDIVIIPSFIEVNGNVPTDYSSYIVSEGVKYPIFESGSSSRIKNQFGGSAYYWWTRSRYTSNSGNVWVVSTGGSVTYYRYSISYYLAPLLRIS